MLREHQMSLSKAVAEVSGRYRELAEAYLNDARAAVEMPPPPDPISLRQEPPAETLLSLAQSLAATDRLDLKAAIQEASRRRPDLVAAWARR